MATKRDAREPQPSRGSQLLRGWRGERKQADVIGRDVLDLDGGRYSAYETGRMRPGLDVAARIARVTRGAVPIGAWLKPARPVKSARRAA